ncbi:hypothetical protein M513_12642, partial [Trichuris suis]
MPEWQANRRSQDRPAPTPRGVTAPTPRDVAALVECQSLSNSIFNSDYGRLFRVSSESSEGRFII